jgi:xylan 1,4-beta-xylosidase
VQCTLTVHCSEPLGELPRLWTSVGYDEINWTYTRRGKALYRTLQDLAEQPYWVRNHNAFTSGNGSSSPASGSTNVYSEQADGSPTYDWTIIDQVYDTITDAGFYPLIELGFMPHDLVPQDIGAADWWKDVGRETYEADGLWKYPPRDFKRWEELVYQFVRHLVRRYGALEVAKWHFEVWNEPNIPNYWKGTLEDYCRLYDHSVAGAVRALPAVQIGGPAAASPGLEPLRPFFEGFLEHVTHGTNYATGKTGTRLSFISHHTKGAMYTRRRIYNWHKPVEREYPSSAVMLNDIRCGLELVSKFAELKDVPLIIDEADPAVGTIYGVFDNPNFVITNSEYYPTFLCALVRRILDLSAQYGNRVQRFTTWAFYFEGKRWFEGNRTLVDNENIEKPVLNALRLLARLGRERLRVESTRRRDVLAAGAAPVEVDALAARTGKKITVLAWHQADEWWSSGRARVTLRLENLPFTGAALVRHFRIDGDHSNAYAEWVRLGRPQDPGPEQIGQLRARQGLELLEPPHTVSLPAREQAVLTFELPLHATSLIEIEPVE